MPSNDHISFGALLKQLRKRAGMTQRDLAAALGYSDSLLSNLENAQVKPDLEAVITRFIPALGLQDEPAVAAHLIEQAAAARGERPPASVSFARTRQVTIQEEVDEHIKQLPLSPTAFIGRSEEVRLVCNRLLGHGGRLLTLVVPPGIGKTRLALAVAASLQHHYAGGAVFVPLAEITDPVLVASAILAAVGSSDASSKLPKIKLIERLRRETQLLVLDNCEQIRDAASLVSELLNACAGIVILATSRERLHLRAEQRYLVPPLDLEPAVQLFSQRVAALDASFTLTQSNRATVEAICRRLDCLPLALELCAGQTDLLSLPQLLARLQNRRLDLLVNGAHDLPVRQRTLHSAIQSSYTLLSEPERTLFRSLGVFVGGFDLEAVELLAMSNVATTTQFDHAAPTGPDSTLHALIGKSLVRVGKTAAGEQRFFLLETLREFALEQLHAHGEDEKMRERHYFVYLHLFRTGDGHLRSAEATTWFARLEAEQDNLRASVQWALDTARYADAAWLLIAVGYFWATIGHRYEQVSLITRLLPYRQAFSVELRLAILIDFSYSARESEEFPSVDQYRAEMIELAEICPSQQLRSSACSFLAQTDVERASAMELARAASEAPTLGPEFSAHADADFALALNQLGYAHSLLYQGEVTQATLMVRDCLHRFRKRGNHAFIAESLGILGNFALIQGRIPEAQAYLQEVMAISETHNLRVVQAEWQWLLGVTTLYGGSTREARRLLESCRQLCLEIKSIFPLAQSCMGLAETALWEGDLDQATEWLRQSVSYQSSHDRITLVELQRLLIAARLATMQGEYKRAATIFGLAEQMHSHIHHVISGPIRTLADDALGTARESLDPPVFAEAFSGGQQLSLEEAYAAILAPSYAGSVTPN